MDGSKRSYQDNRTVPLEEFHRWWWGEEYDDPASEDEVVEFIVNGKKVDVGDF